MFHVFALAAFLGDAMLAGQASVPDLVVDVKLAADPKVEKLKKMYPGCVRKRK